MMLNKLIICTILSISLTSYAGLVDLSNEQMTLASGQGGADLSWTLSLNHQYATDITKEKISDSKGIYYQLDTNACGTGKILCRLAIAPNNHVDANNNKKWLVFKGIQGTVQIDKFSLDGATIINHLGKEQTALQITFEDKYPLKFRNVGFETLAIETAKDGKAEGYMNTDNYDTYVTKYIREDGTISETAKITPSDWFDYGGEKGFMGLNAHGNLHMSGNLKIFSYNCNGTGRC